jgi:hypothetical protein
MVDKVLDTSNATKMLMLGDSLHGPECLDNAIESLMVDKVFDTSSASKMLMLGDSLHGPECLDDAIDGCKRLDNEFCSKWQLNKETF